MEEVVGQQRGGAGGDDQRDRVDEQDGGQETVGVALQSLEDARRATALLGEVADPKAADGRQGGLGSAGHPGQHKADQDHHELDPLHCRHRGRAI